MPTPLKFEGDYSHAAMVERAVRNARPRDPGKHARWVAVMDTFAYGSTTSQQICIHFGLDPNEEIEGPRCEHCEQSDDELTHLRERKEWWQENAEAIAKERGELFRAGEALRHIVQEKTYGCTEVAVWDAAAQPIRDMLAALPAKNEKSPCDPN